MKDYTYICELGHVTDQQPSLWELDECPCCWFSSVIVRPLMKLPHDPAIETAYRLGGPEAALVVLRSRVAGERAGRPTATR